MNKVIYKWFYHSGEKHKFELKSPFIFLDLWLFIGKNGITTIMSTQVKMRIKWSNVSGSYKSLYSGCLFLCLQATCHQIELKGVPLHRGESGSEDSSASEILWVFSFDLHRNPMRNWEWHTAPIVQVRIRKRSKINQMWGRQPWPIRGTSRPWNYKQKNPGSKGHACPCQLSKLLVPYLDQWSTLKAQSPMLS